MWQKASKSYYRNGLRRKKGLKRVLLGSVAENVVRNAECSVLVAR